MLKGVDLDKILDDGYGDAGFNDPVPDLGKDAAAKPAQGSKQASKRSAPPAVAAPVAPPKPKAPELPKPFQRPAVMGATAPPPEGIDDERYMITQALDEDARKKGYNSAEEYSKYLQQSGAYKTQEKDPEEMQLAPGIKKAPAYMPPGAYPGDRTKIGKEYKEEEMPPDPKPPSKESLLKTSYVKQSDKYGARPVEGSTITFRLSEEGNSIEAQIGGASLPWALEVTAKKMKIGDIMDVTGQGEYAFADEEEFSAGVERHWRFELISVGGKSMDKFKLDCDERIERANELRLQGNVMFKQNRLLRAMDYYERGSNLMDVLEAEDLGMPGHTDKKAAERNQRIWRCQQPLLLNWALILMKLNRWRDAERKCTEVLMDIEKENVKALFRRGQCNIHLGNHEQARTDLRRAAELDTSIGREVDREMLKVEEMQREADSQDRGFAQQVVGEFLKENDARSELPPPKEAPPPMAPEGGPLIGTLEAQKKAAEESGLDEESYMRQREAIYSQFLRHAPAPATGD